MTQLTKRSGARSPTDVALDRHLSPVNKTAARVIARAAPWAPVKKIQTQDSQLPIPFGPVDPKSEVHAGLKRGFLTVLGRAEGAATVKGAPYVCKCSCGYYTVRRARALKNPANDKDACALCLHKQFLARRREYLTFGKNLT